jgi:hypothetical protein
MNYEFLLSALASSVTAPALLYLVDPWTRASLSTIRSRHSLPRTSVCSYLLHGPGQFLDFQSHLLHAVVTQISEQLLFKTSLPRCDIHQHPIAKGKDAHELSGAEIEGPFIHADADLAPATGNLLRYRFITLLL